MMSMRTSGMPAPLALVDRTRPPGRQPEQFPGGVDGLARVVPWHPDRPQPDLARALDVPRHVIEEHDLLRRQPKLTRGPAERPWIRLQDPEQTRVDDDVEQLQVLLPRHPVQIG